MGKLATWEQVSNLACLFDCAIHAHDLAQMALRRGAVMTILHFHMNEMCNCSFNVNQIANLGC